MKPRLLFILFIPAFISLSCNLPTGEIEALPAAGTAAPIPATQEINPTETASSSSIPTATLAPTDTPTVTLSPTPNVPTALFLMNANCRSKPDKGSTALMSFLKGESAEIVGRNDELDNTWWFVKIPNSNDKCWVSTITAQVIGSYDDIPTIPPPY
jgi:hypothetical protein